MSTYAAPPRRRSRAQLRGAYPCPVPAGATPDLMAAFERAMSAPDLPLLTAAASAPDPPDNPRLTLGSGALDPWTPFDDPPPRTSIPEHSHPTCRDRDLHPAIAHGRELLRRGELDHELLRRADLDAGDRRELVAPRRRLWLDARRRDEIIGSTPFFLVACLVSWALYGVLVYFYALWTIGPV